MAIRRAIFMAPLLLRRNVIPVVLVLPPSGGHHELSGDTHMGDNGEITLLRST
jgi:hypothetical protein